MLGALIGLVLACTVFVILHCLIRRNKDAIVFDKIPGCKGLPLFGNIFEYILTPETLFSKGRALWQQYGGINRIWLAHIRVVNIYDPDDIEKILSTTKYNEKELPYTLLRPWLREGLLLSNGDKWHKRRKILTPSFHFNILRQFARVINEQSELLVQNISTKVGATKTDVVPLISWSTLNTICETSMGATTTEGISSTATKYFQSIHKLGKYNVYRLFRTWLHYDFLFNLTPVGKQQKKTLEDLHAFTNKIIKQRKNYLMENNFSFEFDDDCFAGKKVRLALLDMMLKAKDDGLIDDIGIREEVDTFMFEGHDTTAMVLCFAITTLANEPDVQAKIYKELQTIFVDTSRPAAIEDFMEMKYLECCIKECLRLYPSVPYIARYLTEEAILSGYVVPKDTVVNIHIYDLHRRGDLFPNPSKFDPDRFSPDTCVSRHPYAYIPFSAGPRNCIGQKFAMLELKSILSSIIRNFHILPVTKPNEINFIADIVLRANHPIYVKFEHRV